MGANAGGDKISMGANAGGDKLRASPGPVRVRLGRTISQRDGIKHPVGFERRFHHVCAP